MLTGAGDAESQRGQQLTNAAADRQPEGPIEFVLVNRVGAQGDRGVSDFERLRVLSLQLVSV